MTTAIDSARNTVGWVESLDGVPVDQIAPNPANPRQHFDEAALAELVESIRQFGVLEPLLVRRRADRSNTKPQFVLIAGERRWRAATIAGVDVPVRVLDVDDTTALRIALVENLVRRDLDPIEEAEGYARLNREGGMRQAEIAAAVNRSQPAVANAMRLLELPEDVRERIRRGELSVSHGIALARHKDFPAVVSKIAELAVTSSWTSKDLERTSDVPGRHELVKAGLAVDFWPSQVVFDAAVCESCPFGAYRKGQYTSPLCLRPEHFRELEAAGRAELQAKAAAAAETLAKRGKGDGDAVSPRGLPKLADLPWQSYERLGEGKRPAGCSDACPCYGMAIDHGGAATAICTDPKRFRKLQSAASREKNKGHREAHAGQVARLETMIDTLPALEAREVAVLAAKLLRHEETRVLVATAKRVAPDLVPVLDQPSYQRDVRSLLTAFSGMPAEDTLRFLLEVILRADIAGRLSGATWPTPLYDWLLGPSPATPSAEGDDRLPGEAWEEEEPSCSVCGCTEEFACEGGCSWVGDEDGDMTDVCSACASVEETTDDQCDD